MDPIKNPFSPGAGSPPPELVGRDPILEQARILLGRIKKKAPQKSLLPHSDSSSVVNRDRQYWKVQVHSRSRSYLGIVND